MHTNQKLGKLIAGRTITGSTQTDGKLMLTFDDGSVMTVKTAPTSAVPATGGKVVKVRQQDDALSLDLEGGTSAAIQMVDAARQGGQNGVRGVDEVSDHLASTHCAGRLGGLYCHRAPGSEPREAATADRTLGGYRADQDRRWPTSRKRLIPTRRLLP